LLAAEAATIIIIKVVVKIIKTTMPTAWSPDDEDLLDLLELLLDDEL
jgi:hypothetical protein